MEKLQEALQKARAERVQSEQVRSPHVARGGTAAAAKAAAVPEGNPVDALWADLKPVALSVKQLTRNRIVSHDHNRESAPFDILRTKIVLLMRKNGWRRLAITSPTEACGKSTLTANMALGLSRQTDIRAIALEFDLRRPALSALLEAKPPNDITRVLSGEVDFGDQAMRVRSNVALSLASRSSPDPTRYLMSHSTEDRLQQIETQYRPDFMIFDTPPVLMSDDTRAFLSKVDCAMIVARAEKTTISQIDNAEREIAEHTNVLGVVLNQAHHVEQGMGYGYYGNA